MVFNWPNTLNTSGCEEPDVNVSALFFIMWWYDSNWCLLTSLSSKEPSLNSFFKVDHNLISLILSLATNCILAKPYLFSSMSMCSNSIFKGSVSFSNFCSNFFNLTSLRLQSNDRLIKFSRKTFCSLTHCQYFEALVGYLASWRTDILISVSVLKTCFLVQVSLNSKVIALNSLTSCGSNKLFKLGASFSINAWILRFWSVISLK